MAVRKIGVNCRSTTGREGYSGQQFESTLERDFLELLAFDYNVEQVETQPLKIYYIGPDGHTRTYTPDVLVTYRQDIVPAKYMSPLLAEVKYREDYRGAFSELKLRLRAARLYARERGWRFSVLTEREIRTPYLENARFLRPYRDFQTDASLEFAVLCRLEAIGESTPAILVESMADSDHFRANYLRVVWKLVAELRIGTDLELKLSMNSSIWFNG